MRATARAGFTLAELLVVILIIGLVLGMGFGAIARLDLGDKVGLAAVQNTLRSARNWAVARNAPARVRFDLARGALRAEGLQVIGTWRFEAEPITGAFDIDGAQLGGHLDEHGFHGRALSFVGEKEGAKVEFPVQHDPACDLREGFRISCAVRTEADGGGLFLVLGESIGLETSENGSVRAWFSPEIQQEHREPARGGHVLLASPPGLLRPGRWSEIELSYDRHELLLSVDRRRVVYLREEAPVWRAEGPLVLSPARQPWQGAIDDLVLATEQAGEEFVLPSKIAFAKQNPAEVRFVAGGALDRELHKEPVTITLELGEGRSQTVQINLLGTVE